MEPTTEQKVAIDKYLTGESLAVEAGAGTGKSSTLVLMADATPDRRIQYTAFNKAIVSDIGAKLPGHASANTAHSLAYKVVGKEFAHRLRGSGRMRGSQIARLLGIDPLRLLTEDGPKMLQPDYLASLAQRAINIYCQTADGLPGPEHIPYVDGIDMPDAHGRRTYANNRIVRDWIAPHLAAIWRDIQDRDGRFPFTHGHYLKLWERSDPRIGADVIMFDEAQDASPVMLSIVEQQTHAQFVFVGDAAQAIYEFTGAVDAITNAPVDHRAQLTQSFRFGPCIADVANLVLGRLDTDLRLKGLPSIGSIVGDIPGLPDALLTRTNSGAIEAVLNYQRDGHRVHLVGGGEQIASFAKAAGELQAGRETRHPELACFRSWGEVQEYTANDPQGDELRLMVRLVDEYGVPVILAALDAGVPEAAAEVIVSTAHKAKGREWDRVRLASDFPEQADSDGELKLLYVAATRAKLQLDPYGCTPLRDLISPPAVEVVA